MKKLLLFVFSAVLLSSCSSDDNIEVNSQSLYGEWEEATSYINGESNPLNDCTWGGLSRTYEFKNDGTFDRHDTCSGEEPAVGTYQLSDDTLTFDGQTVRVQFESSNRVRFYPIPQEEGYNYYTLLVKQ